MENNEKGLMPYMDEYNKFIEGFAGKEYSGAEVGEIIARMAQYYAMHNLELMRCSRSLSLVAKDIEERVDENTGKAISSAKAKILADATSEANLYNIQKTHVQNTEQFINALKSLQKGLLNEYSHMGG